MWQYSAWWAWTLTWIRSVDCEGQLTFVRNPWQTLSASLWQLPKFPLLLSVQKVAQYELMNACGRFGTSSTNLMSIIFSKWWLDELFDCSASPKLEKTWGNKDKYKGFAYCDWNTFIIVLSHTSAKLPYCTNSTFSHSRTQSRFYRQVSAPIYIFFIYTSGGQWLQALLSWHPFHGIPWLPW